MINLEAEASLRVEQAAELEIVCVAGVVWITQEGDLRDLFVAAGYSLTLSPRGLILVTALEPAAVRVIDHGIPSIPSGLWGQLAGTAARLAALVRPRQPIRL